MKSSFSRDVFQAIADPTRREIIRRVTERPLTLSGLAEAFDMSRQAVTKHVNMLVDSGLVYLRTQGRERYCEARLERLNEVSIWVDQLRSHWEARLDSLESYLDQLQTKNKQHGKLPRKGK